MQINTLLVHRCMPSIISVFANFDRLDFVILNMASESERPTEPHPSSLTQPMQIICEEIGDFTKFETILPLEMLGGSEEQKLTLKAVDFESKNASLPDSKSESELTQDISNWNSKRRGKAKNSQPEIANIKFDFHYRTENPKRKEPENMDALVTWVNPKFICAGEGDGNKSESECEEEIEEYIEKLEERKATGFITDETLWYDEVNEVTRNLHKNSISLTNYSGPGIKSNSNYNAIRDFGNAQVLYPELTDAEKRMIGAPDKPIDKSDSKNKQSTLKFKFKKELLDQTLYQQAGRFGSEFDGAAGDSSNQK